MILDKLESFYTQEEQLLLADLQQRTMLLMDHVDTLQIEKEINRHSLSTKKIDAELHHIWDIEYPEIKESRQEIIREASARYFKKYNTEKALLKEVEDIVKALTKEDFIRTIKRNKRNFQKLLKSTQDPADAKEIKKLIKNLTEENYSNYLLFLSGQTTLQQKAFQYHKLPLEAYNNYLKNVATKAYAPTEEEKPAEEVPEAQEILDQLPPTVKFNYLPISPVTAGVIDVMTYGSSEENLERLKTRQTEQAKTPTTAKALTGTFQLGYSKETFNASGEKKVSIEFGFNKDVLKGSAKSIKKFFFLFLEKINKQVNEGIFTGTTIGFPLSEIVDNRMFSTINSARVGFEQACKFLSSFSIKAYLNLKGKNGEASQNTKAILITTYSITNNYCLVSPNKDINWNIFSQFYTIMPEWAYGLSNRAFDLCFKIFFLARQKQNYNFIKEKGFFNISFYTIQTTLDLPDIDKTKNPQRDIKDVIRDTVKTIEEAANTKDLKLDLLCDDKEAIQLYMANGKLKVTMDGEYKNAFVMLAEKYEKQLQNTHNIVAGKYAEDLNKATRKELEAADAKLLLEEERKED